MRMQYFKQRLNSNMQIRNNLTSYLDKRDIDTILNSCQLHSDASKYDCNIIRMQT